MDLQTERNLEQFFKLANIPLMRVTPSIECHVPPFRVFVECVDERVLISTGLKLPPGVAVGGVGALLDDCLPARTLGVPFRAYAVCDLLMLSCTPPPASDARLWLQLYRLQCRLLERHTRGLV